MLFCLQNIVTQAGGVKQQRFRMRDIGSPKVGITACRLRQLDGTDTSTSLELAAAIARSRM